MALIPARRACVLLWCIPVFAESLRIDPPNISLAGPGSSQRYLVSAGDADVTAQASLRSSRPDIVSADPARGQLIARAPGTAEITVRHGDAVAHTTVRVGERTTPLSISFSRDVLSVLTTKGCNSSSCHGSPAGQSGFKLSLYGSDIAADHRMIVTEHKGRRVDLANVANSLFLRKPSYAAAHGGGKLMTPESDEYRTLAAWLQQGAQLDAGGPRLERLEMYPSERILTLSGGQARQPLVAIGRLTDGSTRDMTGEVRFSVADTGVVSEAVDGAVTAKGKGLTIVTARATGKTATSQFIVIAERAAAGYRAPEARNFIDTHVYAKLRQVNAEPYPLTTDNAFLRRVYLDTIGQVPTADELRAFLADTRPDKRARTIDALLERPEYGAHWMVKFEDWFRNHQFNSQGRTNGSFKKWIREVVEQDRPYSDTVRELLTSVGDTTVRPAGNFWHPAIDFMLKTFDVNKITPTVTRLFLGMRIECAECHNHPLENLTQDDFYGMAAFFARLKVKHGYGQYRRIWYNDREGEVPHPVTKKPVAPKFLGGETPAIGETEDRRAALAQWIVAQPQFARATVNRIWSEYFGVGIVEPHDDFRSTNRPTNPELLDQLARFFADSGFRFKPLHRMILNSRVYQTASRSRERPGQSGPLERLLFARYEPRRLPAEVLLDSLVLVTGVPHDFRIYPRGTPAKDLIASNGPDYFLATFGFPRRDILGDRERTPSLQQALHLMNSDTIRQKVEAPDNVIAKLMNRDLEDTAIVNELYLRALSRAPSEAESVSMAAYLASEREAGRSRRRGLENVLWVLLNSKEFRLNQ